MKKINQTILHDPDKGQVGDCMRACVASIFEFPIEEVPHFVEKEGKGGWIKSYLRFLHSIGWSVYAVEAKDGKHELPEPGEHAYYAAIGTSPRDPEVNHMVVCHKGQVVHDPHPDKLGLETIKYFEFYFRLI